MGGRGRRSLLQDHPRIVNRLVKNLELGVPVASACDAVGISKATFHSWMKKGREGKDKVYVDFLDRITQARNAVMLRALKTLNEAADEGDTRAAQWLLERRFPHQFSLNHNFHRDHAEKQAAAEQASATAEDKQDRRAALESRLRELQGKTS